MPQPIGHYRDSGTIDDSMDDNYRDDAWMLYNIVNLNVNSVPPTDGWYNGDTASSMRIAYI